MEHALVHAVWDGALRPASRSESKTFDLFFSFFIPIETILLTLDDAYVQPLALSDAAAVMPGLSFGDVLAEELGLAVPYGSVILVRNRSTWDDASRAVGYAVGDMLLAMIAHAALPEAGEARLLAELSDGYSARAGTDEARELGLDPAAFRRGLSDFLRDHWSVRDGRRRAGAEAVSGDASTRQIPDGILAAVVEGELPFGAPDIHPLRRSVAGGAGQPAPTIN